MPAHSIIRRVDHLDTARNFRTKQHDMSGDIVAIILINPLPSLASVFTNLAMLHMERRGGGFVRPRSAARTGPDRSPPRAKNPAQSGFGVENWTRNHKTKSLGLASLRSTGRASEGR